MAGLPQGCLPPRQPSAPGFVTLGSGSSVSKPGTAFGVATLACLRKMPVNSRGAVPRCPRLHTWANPSASLARGDAEAELLNNRRKRTHPGLLSTCREGPSCMGVAPSQHLPHQQGRFAVWATPDPRGPQQKRPHSPCRNRRRTYFPSEAKTRHTGDRARDMDLLTLSEMPLAKRRPSVPPARPRNLRVSTDRSCGLQSAPTIPGGRRPGRGPARRRLPTPRTAPPAQLKGRLRVVGSGANSRTQGPPALCPDGTASHTGWLSARGAHFRLAPGTADCPGTLLVLQLN